MPDDVELNAGSGGEIIATDQIGTSSGPHYQYVKLASGTLGSTALIPGSTGGLSVLSTGTFTVVNTSSGLLQVIPVTSSGINLYTTAGIHVVSASSGLVQTLSSGPVLLTTGTIIGLSSGTVTLSSDPTVISASSGLVQVLSTGPILLTTGTIIGLSSGVVTLSSVHTILSASSGVIQAIFPVSNTAGFGPVTSSAGVMVTISSGTVTATGPTTITSGTVTLSSAIAISSGLVSVTSGTITLSSNPTVISASSGAVQALGLVTVASSGMSAFHKMSTGGAVATNITTAPSGLMGYAVFNSTATPQAAKFYNSTAPTVGGSTANLLLTVGIPGSTGGGGANLMFPSPGIFSSNGWSLAITANINDTDTGAPGTDNISAGVLYQT